MAVGDTEQGTLTAGTVSTVVLEGNVHHVEITHDGSDPEPIYMRIEAAGEAGGVEDPAVGQEGAHVVDSGDTERVTVHPGDISVTRDRGNIVATSGTNPGQAIAKLISAGTPGFSIGPVATL